MSEVSKFGAPALQHNASFKVAQNPLRGQQVLTTLNITPVLEQTFKGTQKAKLVWVADRETVTNNELLKWLESITKETWETEEELANALTGQFYNTMMPLHVEFWWTYTLADSPITKRLNLYRTQPMYQLGDILKERIHND